MSYRGSSIDREDALYTVLRHLDLTYKDYKILLLEADNTPKFNWDKLADKKYSTYLFTMMDLSPRPCSTTSEQKWPAVKLLYSVIPTV